MNVQFVSDAAGKPTAVLVPIKEWERIQQLLPAKALASQPTARAKPSKKEQFKADFREAIKEMQLAQAGKIQLKTAEEFIAELRELSSQTS